MKILISGGGIAGLSTALCLRDGGHNITIIEKSPKLRGEGYMIDFFGSGYDAAERLGLLPEREKIHYPIPRCIEVRTMQNPEVDTNLGCPVRPVVYRFCHY